MRGVNVAKVADVAHRRGGLQPAGVTAIETR
jgi:hypothetical protein